MSRFGPDDRFWVVRDPGANSTIRDIVSETSLRELMQQVRGGLSIEEHPTIFTVRDEAELEARRRLLAVRVMEAVRHAELRGSPARVELQDSAGKVVLAAELRP